MCASYFLDSKLEMLAYSLKQWITISLTDNESCQSYNSNCLNVSYLMLKDLQN